ncbi:MAG: hypothetical protein HUK01_01995 [Bacteroidaceae bacterium]|nr:hypothetical protein [Bacteroidaceae bacterium]
MKIYKKPSLSVALVATLDIVASSPIYSKDDLDNFIKDNDLSDYGTIPSHGGGSEGLWDGGAD